MRIVFLEVRLYTYRVPFLVELLRHGEIGVIAGDFEAGTREALQSVGAACVQLDSISVARTWIHPQGFREPNPITFLRGVRRHLAQLQPDVIIAGVSRAMRNGAFSSQRRNTRSNVDYFVEPIEVSRSSWVQRVILCPTNQPTVGSCSVLGGDVFR